MNVAVLGTGNVGHAIGTGLVRAGEQVMMGSRTPDNAKAAAWAASSNARHGTFAEAARFGEVVFNCTSGTASLEALGQAGADNLSGKILIDVSNPLDFSKGFPPYLTICNTDSLGEQIQQAFPEAKVVKALNTMNSALMVEPSLVPGDHNVFLSGNDPAAKTEVTRLLNAWFGWKPAQVIDLGDITTARGPEMLLAMWVRLYGAVQTPFFNFHIAVGQKANG